jgi:hypothetical protein
MNNEEELYAKKICDEVHLLLLEDRIAEAASLLFESNKKNSTFWQAVKGVLYRSASCHKELFLTANLVNVAEKDNLNQSYHLVPGLFAFRKQITVIRKIDLDSRIDD